MNDDFDWKLLQASSIMSRTPFKILNMDLTFFFKQKVLQKSNKNIILSPISVKIPLTLLAEAASKNNPSPTAQELSQVLPEQGSLFDAKDYYKEIFDSIKVKYGFNINSALIIYLQL